MRDEEERETCHLYVRMLILVRRFYHRLMMHGLLDLEEVEKVLLEVKSTSYNKSLHETRKKVASMLDLDLDLVEASQKNEIKVKKEKNVPKKRKVKKEEQVACDTKKSAPSKDRILAMENGRATREEDSSDDEDIPLAARRTKAM